MEIECDPNPYASPGTPIPILVTHSFWPRWRIIPTAVCWLAGGLVIVLALLVSGSAIWNGLEEGRWGFRLTTVTALALLGLSGFLLMLSAVWWHRAKWTGAAGLCCIGGILFLISIFLFFMGVWYSYFPLEIFWG